MRQTNSSNMRISSRNCRSWSVLEGLRGGPVIVRMALVFAAAQCLLLLPTTTEAFLPMPATLQKTEFPAVPLCSTVRDKNSKTKLNIQSDQHLEEEKGITHHRQSPLPKTNSNPSDRRRFFREVTTSTAATAAAAFIVGGGVGERVANAQVFMDPAQYGDQELRLSAVDSVKESVRRAILKNPSLAPAFYILALLDGLSYNAATKQFGPDGKVIVRVLSLQQKNKGDVATTPLYMTNLQLASLALIDAEQALRKKTAITLADAIAIGGAEAMESIGGPVLTVQLGRADTPRDGILPNEATNNGIPLDLFDNNTKKYTHAQIASYFAAAGMTEREMTALLCGLLTLERVEKTRTTDDWKQSVKPKFRETGKMGRASEFRRLTEEDIRDAENQAALEADPEYQDPDDSWYIADSFGTRDERFGQRLAKDEINEKNFNKYLKEIVDATAASPKKKKANNNDNDGGTSQDPMGSLSATYGWTASLLTDPLLPTTQTWLQKYAGSNLAFVKDLNASYNSVTQLGAIYTGGKYSDLLQNKKRKSLNDDNLNLF